MKIRELRKPWDVVRFRHDVLAAAIEPMLKLALEAHAAHEPLAVIAAYETIISYAAKCKQEAERFPHMGSQ